MDTNIEFLDNSPAREAPSEPTVLPRKKGRSGSVKKILPIIAVLLLLLFIIIIPLSLKNNILSSKTIPTPTPSPTTSTSTQAVTPTPSIPKTELKVSIKNGTGIPREAAFLKDKITALGYTEIETGNADNDAYESTEVSFSDRVAENIRTELISELDKLYDDVSQSGKKPTADFDIEIITGTRPGITKPTPKPSPNPSESSPSATPRTSTSPSPSLTPTVTPRP